MLPVSVGRRLRGPGIFVLTLLAIELLDEFVYGMRETAWPLIRNDFNLNYAQIGLLLGIPHIVGSVIELGMGILADTGKRRALIVGGGLMFALSCVLVAVSSDFLLLLLAFSALSPASGAFVGLSQATLMDIEPARHEHNMARWTFAGSIGVLTGALALNAAIPLGFGWRELFWLNAVFAFGLWLVIRRMTFPKIQAEDGEPVNFWNGVRAAWAALKRREVLRWFLLLEISDFMLDVLHGFLALYFVDIVRTSETQASIAIAVWTGIGLIGDFLLIPLLERVRGLTYLRYSVVAELILFPAFLLVPGFLPKLVILGLLGLGNAGWYAILQGQVYTVLTGQSGTVMTLGNIFGLTKPLVPIGLGLVAAQFGLEAALWLLLLSPLALLVGLPRKGDLLESEA